MEENKVKEINNQSIKKLISEGKTEEAIELFNLFLDGLNHYKDEMTLMKGNFKNISLDKRDNLIEYAKSNIYINKTNDSILRISNELEKEFNSFISFKKIEISSDSFEEQLNRKLEGDYILEKKPLAEGNTSIIYKAKEVSTEQKVVVRALRNQKFKSENTVEHAPDFKQKPERILNLKHRNLIKIKSFRLDDFPACYIEEYIDGVTLKKLLKYGPLPREKVFSIISQLGKVLYYLHTKGIVHQRILPSKIFLDVEGVPVISPFERFSSNINRGDMKNLAKEIRYLSPEEIYGDSPTEFSDQYGLGVLMYELLTGEKLFNGENIFEIFEDRKAFYDNKKHRQTKLNKLVLSSTTKRVWLKMLSHNQKDRYDCIKDATKLIKQKEGKINSNNAYQIGFESYNRCRSRNLNFTKDFYVNLFRKDLSLIDFFIKKSDSFKSEEIKIFKNKISELKEENIVELKNKLAKMKIPETVVFPAIMLRSAITFMFSDLVKSNHLEKILLLDSHKNVNIIAFENFLSALIETAKMNDYLWNDKIENAWLQTKEECMKKIKELI